MSMLFSDVHVPQGHIWAGTWSTDGTAVCLHTLDVQRVKVPKKGAAKAKPGEKQKENLRDVIDNARKAKEGDTFTVADAFEAVMGHYPAFCSPEAARLWLGRAWTGVPQDRKKEKAEKKGPKSPHRPEHNVIESAWQRITGEKAERSKPPADDKKPKPQRTKTPKPKGRTSRRRVGGQAVEIVESFATAQTSDGLPTWLETLDCNTRRKCVQEIKDLFKSLGRQEAESWSDAETMKHIATVGVDLGQAFPIAMALNSAPSDRSASLTLGPWALEMMRRQANQAQSRLQNQSGVDWGKLWLEERSLGMSEEDQRTRRELKHYDILQRINLQSSNKYGKIKFRSHMQRKRFEAWFAEQVIKWIWPDPEKRDVVLMAIGDECGMGGDGRRPQTVDYAKSLLRSVMAEMKRRKLPIIFRLVDEAYTSQCCPDPACLRPPVANWRQALEEHALEYGHDHAHGRVTEENMAGKEDWVRCRLVTCILLSRIAREPQTNTLLSPPQDVQADMARDCRPDVQSLAVRKVLQELEQGHECGILHRTGCRTHHCTRQPSMAKIRA